LTGLVKLQLWPALSVAVRVALEVDQTQEKI